MTEPPHAERQRGATAAYPRATYRLQLSHRFDFAAAAALTPYLRALGVSHVYASPILRARRGSLHGYDGVDPTQLDPALGGEAGFAGVRQRLATLLTAEHALTGALAVELAELFAHLPLALLERLP